MGIEIVRVEWHRDDVGSVASLAGEVDIAAKPVIDELVAVARTDTFVLDLSDVTFVDVAGIALLSQLSAMPGVTMRNPSDSVRRVAAWLRLDGFS